MSSLRVRQIKNAIREQFEKYIPLDEIKFDDPQRDAKVLSRCLAAFAIYSATACAADEAAASVWDGSDDNGIDAAFFDENQKQVVLVQSKWIEAGTGEPSAAEVGKFLDGTRDLIENNLDGFALRLKQKVEFICEKLLIPGTTVRLILVSTGQELLAEHAQRSISKLLDELNQDEDEGMVKFEVLGLKKVIDSLSSSENRGKITLELMLSDWHSVNEPITAYYGIIDGHQIKEWWLKYGKSIVEKNIRQNLGNTEINLQIKETALKNPEHFWYFNNGITITSDQVIRAPSKAASRATGRLELIGASIVNGAQTVSTLASVADESVSRVRVAVRIIVLSDAPSNFGKDVTRANNLQNRVEGRDFASDDAEQIRIKKEMAIEGIEYQTQRSTDFVYSEKRCELIEVTTALACASSDPAHSVAIKTGIGRFFNDLNKSPYRAIFNPSTNGAKAYNATRILRAVDRWIDSKKLGAKRSGYSWGALVHGNRAIAASVFDLLGPQILNTTISEFDENYQQKVSDACEVVYSLMVETLESDFPGKFLAVLFKNPTSCKQLYEKIGEQARSKGVISPSHSVPGKPRRRRKAKKAIQNEP